MANLSNFKRDIEEPSQSVEGDWQQPRPLSEQHIIIRRACFVLETYADDYARHLRDEFKGLGVHPVRTAAELAGDLSRVDVLIAFGIAVNNDLIALCDEAISETGAKPHRLPSGPLHDAASVAQFGIPTIMMFVQSLHGISHNKIEDTKEEHLAMAVTAFDKLAGKAIRWIESRD